MYEVMQRRDEDLRSELGQTLALFGMAVALVLAVLLAGIGLWGPQVLWHREDDLRDPRVIAASGTGPRYSGQPV
jgi:hypothetical protein